MAAADPIALFLKWYAQARSCAAIVDASAMSLATADRSGRPSVRMVLLKQVDATGFVFYTNLQSPKARDLQANPQAALCFHWAPLRQQIRVYGTIGPVTPGEADRYFATRPRLSQLGAWASQQSQPLPHPYALETATAATGVRFGLGAVPRPPHWSGYRVVPGEIEFWTEKPFRRHRRQLFVRVGEDWEQRWLYP